MAGEKLTHDELFALILDAKEHLATEMREHVGTQERLVATLRQVVEMQAEIATLRDRLLESFEARAADSDRFVAESQRFVDEYTKLLAKTEELLGRDPATPPANPTGNN